MTVSNPQRLFDAARASADSPEIDSRHYALKTFAVFTQGFTGTLAVQGMHDGGGQSWRPVRYWTLPVSPTPAALPVGPAIAPLSYGQDSGYRILYVLDPWPTLRVSVQAGAGAITVDWFGSVEDSDGAIVGAGAGVPDTLAVTLTSLDASGAQPVSQENPERLNVTAWLAVLSEHGADKALSDENRLPTQDLEAIGHLEEIRAALRAGPATALVAPTAPQPYRNSVAVPLTAADLVATPGTVTCTKLSGVGSATAGTYTVIVVAGNPYGRTVGKTGNVTVTTETVNLGVRAAFAQVAGATYYDMYCSTDGANSKFVGRVTEAQRASGIIISAVNVTSAGGAAGAVDIYVPGTGLAAATTAAISTAYLPSAFVAIPTAPYACCDVDLSLSLTGDSASAALTVMPFYQDAATGLWHAGDPYIFSYGGVGSLLQALPQTLRFEARGRPLALLVQNIAGTGAGLAMTYVLS